jgi:microcystin-dependent protein
MVLRSTQYEQGTVESIAEVVLGDELATAVTAGAGTLTLGDVVDFNESGGQLLIGAEILAYTGLDDDANTITLTSGLANAYSVGEPVYVYPDSRERQATVRLDDDGEAVVARVPHALYDRLAEGTRDDASAEVVSLYLDGDEWVVDDVLGIEPLVDGSYLDPDTIPPPAPSDGLPPTGTPSVLVSPLGIGSLFVQWSPLVNADVVSYDVHISPTSGFTPSSATLSTTVVAQQSATIAKLPDDTPLSYDTDYYVRVAPHDVDGYGTTSQEATGRPRQAENADFSAETIYAMKISANSIQSGQVDAELLIAGTIKTADTGQRVEIDGQHGLVNYGPDNTPRVILPTGGSDPAVLRGVAEVDTLTVHGNAEFQAGAHINTGQAVVLDSAVQAPVSQPQLSAYYPSLSLYTDQYTAAGSRFGLVWQNSRWWQANLFYGTFLTSYDPTTGALLDTLHLPTAEGALTSPDALWASGGLTRIGSAWYLLGYRHGNGQWQVRKYDDTGAELLRWNYSPTPAIDTRPAIGYAKIGGVDTLLIARCDSNGTLRISGFVPDTGAASGSAVVSTTNPGKWDVAGVAYGQFDFASVSRYVVAFGSAGGSVHTWVSDTGGVLDTTRYWLQGGQSLGGFTWDGTRFVGRRTDTATLTYYNSIRAEISGDSYNLAAAATYRDSVNGYETTPGASRQISIAKRAGYSISIAALPTGVDSVRFHISAAGGAYAPCTPQPAVGLLAQTYASLTTSGVTPTSNTFPNSTPAQMRSATMRQDGTPKFQADGAGAGRFDGLIPPGSIIMFGGSAAPPGWLICDGSSKSRVLYPDLFAALGSGAIYGTPDANNFYLPDMRSRYPRGVGASATLGGSDGKPDDGTRNQRHTHSISAAGTFANMNATPNTGGVNSPRHVDFQNHDHGGATGLSAAADFPNLGVNFLIKT